MGESIAGVMGPDKFPNYLFWAAVLAITVIGIPFALQHLKLIPLSLFPFGRHLEG